MAKRKSSTKARFSDTLIAATQGEQVDLLVHIDRSSPDYVAGAAARKAGEPRDSSHSLMWLWGWDEKGKRPK